MIVLVTGGRNYEKKAEAMGILDAFHARHPISFLIEGGAGGADRLAKLWRESRGIDGKTFEAAWGDMSAVPCVVRTNSRGEKYNAAAGTIRNERMAREGRPDGCVVFPGGRGTADMLGIVRKIKRTRPDFVLWIVDEMGKVAVER